MLSSMVFGLHDKNKLKLKILPCAQIQRTCIRKTGGLELANTEDTLLSENR